jgi:hypothetical protein
VRVLRLIFDLLLGNVEVGDVQTFFMRLVSMQSFDGSFFSETSPAHAAELLRRNIVPPTRVAANERRFLRHPGIVRAWHF